VVRFATTTPVARQGFFLMCRQQFIAACLLLPLLGCGTKPVDTPATVVATAKTVSADVPKDALIVAARKGDVAAVKSLLDGGADPNAKTEYGATALSFAADKGHAEIVKLLIASKANVNSK